jgi:uncharacterized protein (DUF2147 family)
MIKFILVAAVVLAGTAAATAAPSPTGDWRSATGDSRYQISMCGDGKSVCAKLTWLRADARTPENLKYLNKQVVQAKPTGANSWRGTVNLHGTRASGKLTMKDANTIQVQGCKAIFCRTMQFERI